MQDDQAKPLTPRQRELCDVIKKFTRSHGHAPTLRELAVILGIHATRVRGLALEARARGHLVWSDRTARTMRVLRHANRR